MNDLQEVIDSLVEKLAYTPEVEGVFLAGSLVNEDRDDYSDIDLCIASADDPTAFQQVWETRLKLATVIGEPLHLLNAFPFYIHEAFKALHRDDTFAGQAVLEEMRQAIFILGALRDGVVIVGAKRAGQHLSSTETRDVDMSYRAFIPEMVQRLVNIFTGYVSEISEEYGVEGEFLTFQQQMRELV